MNIKPLANRVIIFPTDQNAEEVRESGLIVLNKEIPPSTRGVVVAVGPKVTEVVVGDKVQYGQHSGAPFPWEDKEYLIMRDTEIICIF